ncbi:hypothetical protein SLH49_03920 [Cognatiyoonia sp. IB215446]|uniref:hypothetical protein n=1 Tax=Cognatiyoonia sp. IB215446 TaxID=3097355 RepID=UPI002A11E912|nr:hypothetical protein [Cognatiyoonia sp. IB215446]MDX8347126.1 hypothetical protein [Cognatiyoonia sp. IB215446]
MKVIKNTPQRLVLRSLPHIGIIFLGILFLTIFGAASLGVYDGNFVGAVFGYLIAAWLGYKLNREAQIDEVALDRDAGLLEIKRYSLKGRERVRHPLSDLSYADLDMRPHKINLTERRVALVLDRGMDAGRHPLTTNFYTSNTTIHAADAINSWLNQ